LILIWLNARATFFSLLALVLFLLVTVDFASGGVRFSIVILSVELLVLGGTVFVSTENGSLGPAVFLPPDHFRAIDTFQPLYPLNGVPQDGTDLSPPPLRSASLGILSGRFGSLSDLALRIFELP